MRAVTEDYGLPFNIGGVNILGPVRTDVGRPAVLKHAKIVSISGKSLPSTRRQRKDSSWTILMTYQGLPLHPPQKEGVPLFE